MDKTPPITRIQEVQLMQWLHRLTGVGVLLFLALHIVHIWLMALGPDVFDAVTAFLRQPLARVLHIFLFFSVLFHAANGLRVTLLDFIPPLEKFRRESIYITAFVVALVFIPSMLLVLMDGFLPSL
jgi:succinate dehydrogenase / fumarate reductase cytochrome b subunit